MLETLYEPDFLSPHQVEVFIDGHNQFCKLFVEEFLETDKPVHIDQFQTSGFWHKHDEELQRKLGVYEVDKVHVEYQIDEGGLDKGWGMPDGKPEFVDFLNRIKPQFDVEDFHHYVLATMNSGMNSVMCKDYGKFYWTAFYDINYNFECHCDGRDIKDKRGPRPDNWNDLSYDDWHQEEDFEFTRQGLVSLDVDEQHDGTVIFNQSFPYSMYVDFSKLPHEFPILKDSKNKIKFAKGDTIERFGAKIEQFTYKPFDEDEYDEIMENCVDESIWPIEAGYGLSLDKVCLLGTPGTMYSWDCKKFHKTRPFVPTTNDRRRLTLAWHCGRHT
jgi:hypothetical protein